MGNYYWVRTVLGSTEWPSGSAQLANIPSGYTYTRVHFRWGVYADSMISTNIEENALNIPAMGLVTTIGNGSESIPNARTAAFDADPPTQRWIYWESRALIVSAIDYYAGVITYRDSGSTEPTTTKGQVLATGLPSGDTLNLNASWAGAYGWDAFGNISVWFAASILVREP